MATVEKYLDAEIANIPEAIKFIEEKLKKSRVKRKDAIKALLLAEEFLVYIINGKDKEDSDRIRVAFNKGKKAKQVIISYKGKKIENIEDAGLGVSLDEAEMSPETESVIRKTIISANRDAYVCGYKNGINKVSITVGESSHKAMIFTLYAFVLAIAAGVLIRLFVPKDAAMAIQYYGLETIKTLFLNAFRLITGPVVFFSIAASISTFSDLKELGKTAVRVILFYLMTTGVAVVLGLVMYYTFTPGNFGEMAGLLNGAEITESDGINPVEAITGIVPDNLFKPFLEENTLQIMVVAILVGIAAGRLGARSQKVAEFLDNANELFIKIAGFVTKFLPIMIFASLSSLVLTIDVGTSKSILSFLLVTILGLGLMIVFYIFIAAIGAKTNPIKYFKNVFSAWLNAFVLCSSSAAMPKTMEVCEKNLKVKPKLFSFSIPLGATINMDGFTILLIISALFFANVYGINMPIGNVVALIIMSVILSAGTPGIPGSGIVCTTTMFAQFGIPADAVAIITGFEPILDPIITADNVLGDITGTYVVAKRHGLTGDINS